MKWLIYHLYLKPLIRRNLKQRELGELPDEWYWADLKAIDWGYYYETN